MCVLDARLDKIIMAGRHNLCQGVGVNVCLNIFMTMTSVKEDKRSKSLT